MIRNKKQEKANSIPIHFADEETQAQVEPNGPGRDAVDDPSPSHEVGADSINETMEEAQRSNDNPLEEAKLGGMTELVELDEGQAPLVGGSEPLEGHDDISSTDSSSSAEEDHASSPGNEMAAGPMLAELIATRAELRRVETDRNDLLERLARRQADFENFRKRVERERGETFQRIVGDVVSKLLPVMDNMRRALQAESILEKNESAEFRHFLRGVELIYKQLNDALQELGVEPVPAVGQPFDPHVHEAVATEHSDEYEPDTVTQELLRGYRLGEKLLRPAMVKVSTRQ
jgi:molecular chaperone GrpE